MFEGSLNKILVQALGPTPQAWFELSEPPHNEVPRKLPSRPQRGSASCVQRRGFLALPHSLLGTPRVAMEAQALTPGLRHFEGPQAGMCPLGRGRLPGASGRRAGQQHPGPLAAASCGRATRAVAFTSQGPTHFTFDTL